MLLSLLLSCSGSPEPPNDRELHAQALHDGANADCSQIQDRRLRGDCESWRAGKLALTAPQQAEALCAAIDPIRWRQECWFLVSDAELAEGEDAVRLCEQAGTYERQCLGHAITRSAQGLLAVPGRELEVFTLLEEHWAADMPALDARAVAERTVAAEVAARPKPMTEASFGAAPHGIQLLALSIALQEAHCATDILSPDLDPLLVQQALFNARC